METGWKDTEYLRNIPLHVRLQNGKIQIEEDMTEEGIGEFLVEQGVPRRDIILGFHAPEIRRLAEPALV